MALSSSAATRKDISTGRDVVTFQHRHFSKVAAILKSMDDADQLSEADMRNVVETFANALADTNPNFDRSRFLKACGNF